MAKKMTNEEFVEKAVAVHGDRYDYSKVAYRGTSENVEIGCKVHGSFWQVASIHTNRGAGCPDCSISVRAKGRSHTEDEFISKALSVHGGKYDYSKAKYTNTRSKIEIICNTCHTSFWQSPNAHTTYSQGCSSCAISSRASAARLDNEYFIARATAAHGHKYDYSSTMYTGALDNVEIGCREHGNFWQRPAAHISGSIGCPSCTQMGGYRKESPGYFYLLSDGSTSKVGITNLTVEERMKSISRSSRLNFTKKYSVYFEDGAIAQALEKRTLRFLRLTYSQPLEVFDGSTEAFIDVDVEQLMTLVESQISVLTDENNK